MIPKIKECIPYIEGCGYKFQGYNRPWYLFTSIRTEKLVTFTLTEIREAFKYGW